MDQELERKVGYSVGYTAALVVDWTIRTGVAFSATRFLSTSASKYKLSAPLDGKTLFERVVDASGEIW